MAIVLIESFAWDVHAHAVAWALRQLGVRCYLLFGDNFPVRSTIDLQIERNGSTEIAYAGPEGEYRITDRDKVVYIARRSCGPVLPVRTDAVEPDASEQAGRHRLAELRMSLENLPHCVTVNSLAARRRAECKPLQLLVASRCGMSIPETLYSNNEESVVEFVSRQKNCIYKTSLPALWEYKYNSESKTYNSFSRSIHSEDLPLGCDVIRSSNGIYQEEILKAFEVRVVAMGSSCIAAKLHSQEAALTSVDWRAGQVGLRIEPMGLPREVVTACLSYLAEMRLLFGCFDFIVTPNGDWFFLECNQQGQWLWQEVICPELPLLDAYIDFICAPDRGFEYRKSRPTFRFLDYYESQWQMDWRRSFETSVVSPNPFFGTDAGSC